MSYMKAGRAGRWANREFEHEAKSGHLRFIDWVDFEEEFRKDFMPLDSEAAAEFRQGLDCQISMALAGMTYGRPADTDPEAWFCLAIQMDQNRAANEAFHTSHRQPNLPTPGISHIPMAS